jgi:iron complex outermembrane recepter protein
VGTVQPLTNVIVGQTSSYSTSRRRHLVALSIAVAPVLVVLQARAQLVPPKVTSASSVEYPAEVTKPPAVDVTVLLMLSLDETGKVVEAKVKGRTPDDADDAFVTTALAHARTLSFSPATKDGVAVTARIPYTVTFARPGSSTAVAPPASATVSPSASTNTAAPVVSAAAADATKPKNETNAAVGDEKEGDRHPHGESEITVTGRTEPKSHGNSDFHIHLGSLALVPRKNASDFLKLAPGILLTNDGGEGHAEQVFLRGFDAREGQDLEFTVGGVPINDVGNLHGNGYADTHFIIPELINSLRVVEGPFSPSQGNFAVAGSVDYELGLEKRGLTAKYTVGSFDTNRLLLLWGPGSGSSHTFGGVEIYDTKGFGQNRDARRGTAMGQYEGELGTHGSYRITATGYATSFHSAGVLRQDDYDAGRKKFFDTYDTLQGGDASRWSLAGDYESQAEDISYRQLLFVISRDMRLRENFTGFLLDTQDVSQQPHAQRGDLLDLAWSGITIGAKGSARFKAKVFDLPQELELGWFARGDRSTATQYRIETATGHPYHLDTDIDAKLGNIGLYADGSLKLAKWLTLRGGLRADVFTYDVLDNCAVKTVARPSTTNPPGDASCLSQQGAGDYREPVQRSSTAATAFMPRATLLIGSIQGFTFSASYGQGIRSIDPIYISQDKDTPFASVKAYEGGVGYVKSTDDLTVTARSIFFQTRVDRDLIFSESEGRNTLGGGSKRTGWVGAMRLTGDFFDQAANITLVRAEYDDTHLLVPYVPDVVVRSDTALFANLPFTIAGEKVKGAIGGGITYVGHRPLPYGQRSDVVFTLDSTAALSWKGYELGFTATNLLGRRYRLGEYNYTSDFHSQGQATLVPMRHFTAGAPRAFYLSFSATFGGS